MSELYLQHYGVKGMKWGVRKERKPSSKEIHNDYLRQRDKFVKDDPDFKAVKKRQAAFDKKYPDYDHDDGGRLPNQKAFNQWDKIQEDWERAEDQAYDRASAKANANIRKKYGEKQVAKAMRRRDIKGTVSGYLAISGTTALTGSLLKSPAITVGGQFVANAYAAKSIYDIATRDYRKRNWQ
ncbi:MAG: hypothetical protein [Chaetfec virus UA24_144]|nr:MAG: hypothetical protein [Chaetfec virus UA24_144]